MTTANTIATTVATVATTQRPRYAQTGRATRCVAFLASTVLSTVLIGSVVIGMTTPTGRTAVASEQA